MQIGNRHIIFLLLSAGLILGFASCNKNSLKDCLDGRGKTSSESRGLYSFDNISVHDNISLKIIQGPHHTAVITTGENVIPFITTSIEDNILFIRNESVCTMFTDPWDNVDVEVSMPDIDTIFIQTAGDVVMDSAFHTEFASVKIEESSGDINLTFDVLKLNVHYLSGTANVWVNGTGRDGAFYCAAYGVLDTRGFISNYTAINSNSTNNCFVTSGVITLDVKITNMGDIYYIDQPLNLIEVIEGPGKLIRLGP